MQALGSVGEEIAVLMHGAALHRHTVPDGGNRALEPGSAIDDEKFGPPQAVPSQVWLELRVA